MVETMPRLLPASLSAALSLRSVLAALCSAGMIAAAVGADSKESATPKEKPAKPDFAKDVGPLIEKYCFDCHTGDEPEGDFSLYFDTERDLLRRASSERAHFEKMYDVLREHEMPPRKKAQPTNAERDKILEWLERTMLPEIDKAGTSLLPSDAGRNLARAESFRATASKPHPIVFRAAVPKPAADAAAPVATPVSVSTAPTATRAR